MATIVKRKRTATKISRKRATDKLAPKKNKVRQMGLLKGRLKQLVPGDIFNLK
jgi:hypothetical protein